MLAGDTSAPTGLVARQPSARGPPCQDACGLGH